MRAFVSRVGKVRLQRTTGLLLVVGGEKVRKVVKEAFEQRSSFPMPTWLERDGEKLELCVRGDRLDCRHGFPLEHEMTLQRLLHEHGIPVAKVYGWIDDPRAYVMDRVAGVEHFRDTDDATRDAVSAGGRRPILVRAKAVPARAYPSPKGLGSCSEW